jgi:hypothetical protein
MHLYDYQSSVNNITMCWLVANVLTFVVCVLLVVLLLFPKLSTEREMGRKEYC